MYGTFSFGGGADDAYGGRMSDDEYVDDTARTANDRIMDGEHLAPPAAAAEPMEQDAEVDPTWLDSMPAPDTHLLQRQENAVRFQWSALPKGMPGFPSHILRAVGRNNGLVADQQHELARHLCLPVFVHVSPAVLLFSAHFQAPADHKGDLSDMERPWWPQCGSLLYSWVHLLQLRGAALLGHAIKLHEEVRVHALAASHMAAIRSLADAHDAQLDAYYHAVQLGELSYEGALDAFVQACTRYAFTLLHVEERLLFHLLVEPYVGAPPLGALLTPAELPPPERLTDEAVRALRQDARIFFMRKREALEGSNVAWHVRLDLLDAPRSPHDVHGWLPRELVRDYFHFADDERRCLQWAPEHWPKK